MQRTEAQQSDIIEQLLDELENRTKKPEKVHDRCEECLKELTYSDVSDDTCSCGVIIQNVPSLPIFRSLDIQRKKSVYKPVIYGRAILQSAMGALLPVSETKFTSLLHIQDIDSLVNKLKKVQEKMEIKTEKIDVDMTRYLLKKINKGCYYKYACYLTSMLNLSYKPLVIPPADTDKILVRFRAIARTFARKKNIFNRQWGSKRKSLPFVPIILRVICENLGLNEYTRDLPQMKSKKRQEKIRKMAQYLYEQSNFLLISN